jgi:hypothetical protein
MKITRYGFEIPDDSFEDECCGLYQIFLDSGVESSTKFKNLFEQMPSLQVEDDLFENGKYDIFFKDVVIKKFVYKHLTHFFNYGFFLNKEWFKSNLENDTESLKEYNSYKFKAIKEFLITHICHKMSIMCACESYTSCIPYHIRK